VGTNQNVEVEIDGVSAKDVVVIGVVSVEVVVVEVEVDVVEVVVVVDVVVVVEAAVVAAVLLVVGVSVCFLFNVVFANFVVPLTETNLPADTVLNHVDVSNKIGVVNTVDFIFDL